MGSQRTPTFDHFHPLALFPLGNTSPPGVCHRDISLENILMDTRIPDRIGSCRSSSVSSIASCVSIASSAFSETHGPTSGYSYNGDGSPADSDIHGAHRGMMSECGPAGWIGRPRLCDFGMSIRIPKSAKGEFTKHHPYHGPPRGNEHSYYYLLIILVLGDTQNNSDCHCNLPRTIMSPPTIVTRPSSAFYPCLALFLGSIAVSSVSSALSYLVPCQRIVLFMHRGDTTSVRWLRCNSGGTLPLLNAHIIPQCPRRCQHMFPSTFLFQG